MGRRRDSTAAAKINFITEFQKNGGSMRLAAEAIGVHETTPYLWRKDDQEFATKLSQSSECWVTEMEDEARRRALAGSDVLMMFMLKARRPDLFDDGVRRLAAKRNHQKELLTEHPLPQPVFKISERPERLAGVKKKTGTND